MGVTLTFRTRDGEQRTFQLGHYDTLSNILCPVDGTRLVSTNGDDYDYVHCKNCEQVYYTGEHPKEFTQEQANEAYRKELADNKSRLERLREDTKKEEATLLRKINELENPFTQFPSN